MRKESRRPKPSSCRFRPQVERLESRQVLNATVDVDGSAPDTDLTDGVADIGDGRCSLTAAIAQLNYNGGGTITIATNLEQAGFLPSITVPMTIDGGGHSTNVVLTAIANGCTFRNMSAAIHITGNGAVLQGITGGVTIRGNGATLTNIQGAVGITGGGNVLTNVQGDVSIVRDPDSTGGNTVRTSVGRIDVSSDGANIVTDNVGDVSVGGIGNVVTGNRGGFFSVSGANSSVMNNDGNGEPCSAGGNGTLVTDNENMASLSVTGAVIARGNKVGFSAGGEPLPLAGGVSVDGNGAVVTASAIVGGVVVIGNGNRLEGNTIGTNADGTAAVGARTVRIVGGSNVIKNNVISGEGEGVQLDSAGSGSNRIEGNKIGTNAAGSAIIGQNFLNGIRVESPNNHILNNVISGNKSRGIRLQANAGGTVIKGNFIGTDVAGTKALANGLEGIAIHSTGTYGNIVIGGTGAEGNVISGNGREGIHADRVLGITVVGNRVGTNAAGTAAIPNQGSGASITTTTATIGGTSTGAGNVFSGNLGFGFTLDANNSLIQGNRFGSDVTGTKPIGNGGAGMSLRGDKNTIKGNVFASNKWDGVGFSGNDNTFFGNAVGTSLTGSINLGNLQNGLDFSGDRNKIGGIGAGEANTVAYNGKSLKQNGHGILVFSGIGNAIRRNSIFANEGRGIELYDAAAKYQSSFTINDPGDADKGTNNLQNYPTVTSRNADGTTVWTLGGLKAGAKATIEFFSNEQPDPSGFGEGKTYLGAVTAVGQADGRARVTCTFKAKFISATATDAAGNTSEFSTVDTDGDALADAWEAKFEGKGGGLDVDEDGKLDLDLTKLEVPTNPNHKDILVEVDAMAGYAPSAATLQRVVDDPLTDSGFARAPAHLVRNPDGRPGIALHVLRDETNVPAAGFAAGMAWQGFEPIKKARFGKPDERTKSNWQAIRIARTLTYRYCLFAVTQGPGNSSSGRSELHGNDFMVTLGLFPTRGGTAQEQAATFMHELGHTLGLRHDGGQLSIHAASDLLNYKPNYHSIMNYTWQFGYPAQVGWSLDYSRETGKTLIESNLNEATGIGLAGRHAGHVTVIGAPYAGNALTAADPDGRGGALFQRLAPEQGAVDWNWDNLAGNQAHVHADANLGDHNHDGRVNASDMTPGQVLQGGEDWSRLLYAFVEEPNFADSVHGVSQPAITAQTVRALANSVAPVQVGFKTDASRGNESVSTVKLTVTLSKPAFNAVTVRYAVSGGTAKPNVDFRLPAGTLTFRPGEVSKVITVTVLRDEIREPAETVQVSLSSPRNAMLGAIKKHTYTIQDAGSPVAARAKRTQPMVRLVLHRSRDRTNSE